MGWRRRVANPDWWDKAKKKNASVLLLVCTHFTDGEAGADAKVSGSLWKSFNVLLNRRVTYCHSISGDIVLLTVFNHLLQVRAVMGFPIGYYNHHFLRSLSPTFLKGFWAEIKRNYWAVQSSRLAASGFFWSEHTLIYIAMLGVFHFGLCHLHEKPLLLSELRFNLNKFQDSHSIQINRNLLQGRLTNHKILF